MKVFAVILIAAIAAQVQAGHKHGEVAQEPIAFAPAQPITAPSIVDESERSKSCPPGFAPLGKQCAQTLTIQPNTLCPPGTVRTNEQSFAGDDTCAKFVGKLTECPAGFERHDNGCKRHQQADALTLCDEGYSLTPEGKKCSRAVPLAPAYYCPAGQVQKGDSCVTQNVVTPQVVCPPGFTQEGKKCRIEETFDCTPPRQNVQFGAGKKHLRLLGSSHHKDTPYPFAGPVIRPGKNVQPTTEEYVVSKTCKRIRTEGARKICPPGGVLDGKTCIVEEVGPLHEKPGGFREEVVPAKVVCPEGYAPSAPFGRFSCIATEEVAANLFCPPGTQDVGSKCAIYKPSLLSCPPEYTLEGEQCIKTLFAPPLVEFTVTYACTGKNCDQARVGGKHHK